MKKMLSIVFVVVFLLNTMIITTISTNAEELIKSGDFEYMPTGTNNARITDYFGSSNVLSIPDTIDGRTVTSIHNGAFSDNTSLTVVIIPDSVTRIEFVAFKGCTNLVSITIPDTVTYIGNYAFADCTRLAQINLPENLNTINNNVFANCTSLKSIEIPESVTKITEKAFENCTGLTEIHIPSLVSHIESSAFNGCTGLLSITVDSKNERFDSRDNCNAIIDSVYNDLIVGCCNTYIPKTVSRILRNAFRNQTKLTNIIIPDSVTYIGGTAFSGCTRLQEINLPKSLTSIEEGVFSGCTSLKKIVIPNSVTEIENYAFSGCKSIESISIPASVTKISNTAFKGCDFKTVTVDENNLFFDSRDNCNAIINTKDNAMIYGGKCTTFPPSVTSIDAYAFYESSIEKIDIPDTITKIGVCAFTGCENLTQIKLPRTITTLSSSVFSYCSALESIVVPNSVTSIDMNAFYRCYNLREIQLSNKLETIGRYAFSDCLSLEKITIPRTTTDIGFDAFMRCYSLTDMYVLSLDCEIEVDGLNYPAQPSLPTFTRIYYYSGSYVLRYAYQFGNPIVQLLVGDADGDYKVSVIDATMVQKYLSKDIALDDVSLDCADTDKDSIVSVMDATRIQMLCAGVLESL